MFLELVRESETAAGGIIGRLFVDGQFFGYTLENAAAAIPAGNFNLYTRFSPKLQKNKLSIDVPGRQYIMFHGGNTPEDSAGCVLVARTRNEDGTIYGDVSDALYNAAKDSADAGTAQITIRYAAAPGAGLFVLAALIAAGLYYLTK